jgi:8-oxo-dGTP pyrophosphatase MutT (NUDIX family)
MGFFTSANDPGATIRESSWSLGRSESVVHSGFVAAKLRLIRTGPRRIEPFREALLSAAVERSRQREQVAAVCYRVRSQGIEFLLVRTRKGRWTFPKGGVVRGWTRAESAALEAFEEGGVHGRIEQASFARYLLRKREGSESPAQIRTHAHLCEVLRVGMPQEANRNPTWFSPEQAQLRLKIRRTKEDAGELARVLERAVTRIERLASSRGAGVDPLQRSEFEAPQTRSSRLIARVALLPFFRRKPGEAAQPPLLEFDADASQTLRLGPARPPVRPPR